MKLQPQTWGPIFWLNMHITALGYSQKPSYGDKKAAKDYMESLQFLLPCQACREHYKVLLSKHPLTPHLDRREDFFKYTVMIHNEVNKMLKKPIMTEIEALLYIKRLGARKDSPIINREMFEEIDMRSMIKGGFIGGAIFLLVGSGVYLFSKEKN
jgi:hypothetical protein